VAQVVEAIGVDVPAPVVAITVRHCGGAAPVPRHRVRDGGRWSWRGAPEVRVVDTAASSYREVDGRWRTRATRSSSCRSDSGDGSDVWLDRRRQPGRAVPC